MTHARRPATLVAAIVSFKNGEDVEKIVAGFFRVGPAVVATLREALVPKP